MENQSLTRRYQRLVEIAPNYRLDEHLGLINEEQEKSSIFFEKFRDYLYLKFNFMKTTNLEKAELIRHNYIGLPMEINEIIADFVLQKNELSILVCQFYPNLYPYFRPHLEIIDIQKNFDTKVDLESFYKRICNTHNRKEWHTSVLLDKDILDLYIDFSRMDYILEN